MNDEREQAFQKLGIQNGNKVLLCVDGGGMRGIMTLELLKKLEELAGIPCYKLCDMVAGTSTGGIIAALIASGHNAFEVVEFYTKLLDQVFTKRSMISGRFIDPPQYTKQNFRSIICNMVGSNTTLADVCKRTGTDLMITAKDVTAGEETFFSCFEDNGIMLGTYKDVLLRSAMEATVSAPTYFTPLERFVDGGVTTYNNATMGAIIEAVHYGPANKYQLADLTVFSFGTGCTPQFVPPNKVVHPDGPDSYFWLKWIMTESSEDASDMQDFLLRSKIFNGLDFRRFQISLDTQAIHKLPNRPLANIEGIDAKWLWDLTETALAEISPDKISLLPLMKVIGEALVEFIVSQQNIPFGRDLVGDDGKELLVSRMGDIVRIKTQMSDPVWLNNFEF
jgi:uncharacterized protein